MKVLLADDSALLRGILREVLGREPDITIVGEATNGEKAIQQTIELKPDLIIMDVNMPVINGIEATKHIMEHTPTPVLVFTSEVEADKSFDAIEYGAIEILKKPPIDQLNDPAFYAVFIERIRTLAQKKRGIAAEKGSESTDMQGAQKRKFSFIVFGASTGGPVVVRELLHALPEDFPIPVAVVQHLESGFDGGYADWLNEDANITVTLANERGRLLPGTAVIAPSDYHLRCTRNGYILDKGEKVLNQRPSVDVLFSSAADVYGAGTLGILLTGMGRDGANGCVAIKANGGFTICQDQNTSAIFGMPKAAIELKGASRVMPLSGIVRFLKELST